MELTAAVDSMEAFIKATYVLERDGPLALTAYEQVSMLYSVVSTEHYSNVHVYVLANLLLVGKVHVVAHAKACVEAVYVYFKPKFDHHLRPTLLAFKAARYFCHQRSVNLGRQLMT